MKIGFVGIGRMGSRIARNLLRAGHDLEVWNRTTRTAEQWVAENGGTVGASLRQLAERNELLITMLADGDALVEVYRSADGLVAGISPATIALDMGTSGPEHFAMARRAVEGRGAVMLDAPVSGATAAAEAGSLLIMVGGSEEEFERVERVLQAVGRPTRVGPIGSATVLKLAVNSVLYGINQAVAEAVALAELSGVDAGTTLDVLIASAAGAPLISYRKDVYLHPGQVPVMFTLELARKDLLLAIDQAERTGAGVPQLQRTLETVDRLIEQGYGAEDLGYAVEAARNRARPDEAT